MAGRRQHGTGIQWTHFPPGYLGVEQWKGETWNPTSGCTRVSPGCDHCYAFALHDMRYADNLRVAREVIRDGAHVDLSGETAIREPLNQILAVRRIEPKRLTWPPQYDQPFSTVQLLEPRLQDPQHWKVPRAVFVDSMADLFHEDVPDRYLDGVFAAMALAPHCVFMILTKRPERAHAYLTTGRPWERIAHRMYDLTQHYGRRAHEVEKRITWPLPNVWQGTSVENQQAAAERIPWLLRTPAALHFLSLEPLLDAVNLRNIDAQRHEGFYFLDALTGKQDDMGRPYYDAPARIDWVLVGGESGRGWRPMATRWAADIQRQCHEAGVAYFGKQRADFRSSQPLPGEMNEHQWPAALWGGRPYGIWTDAAA